MTMQQVQYVLEVARTGSVSRAAEGLYLSQSALSQQLRRLEAELGYPLFLRTAHGLQLTPEGARFCALAGPAAAQWAQLCDTVNRDRAARKPRLRLGIGSRVYSNHLFEQIVAFFEANPQVEVTFVTEAGLDPLEALRKGELDLALDRLPESEAPEPNSRFFSCPLVRERQCVLLQPGDPRADLAHMDFRALQGCAWVTGLEDSAEDRILREACRRYQIRVGRIYRSDGISTSMRLVRDGRGVALGPASFADYFQVAAVPLEPEQWVWLRFLCLKSSLKRPEIRQLRDYLLELCRDRA